MPNNKSLNDEYTWKRKITYIYRNTLALLRLTQCQVMLFRYVYTTASHAALQEQVSPSTQSMQFCNTTTHIKVVLSHHLKQDTSIISILHCIKLITAVCLGCQYQQI